MAPTQDQTSQLPALSYKKQLRTPVYGAKRQDSSSLIQNANPLIFNGQKKIKAPGIKIQENTIRNTKCLHLQG